MRVLIVGGMQQKKMAKRYYDVVPKLMNGFARNGHAVMHFADRDISRMSNFMRSRKMGIKPCNTELIKTIQAYEPNLIVFKHADVILPDTVEEIKHSFPAVKLAQVNVDALFNPDNVARIRTKAGFMDANFITTGGASMKKVKVGDAPVYFIPNPVDPSHESAHAFAANPDDMYDLLFAYGNAPEGDPRHEIPRRILRELPEVNFKLCVAGQGSGLWGYNYTRTLGLSKCGLNLSRKNERGRHAKDGDLYMYSSDRVAHYVGNGLLTLSDAAFDMTSLFSEKEMVYYDGEEDLHEKIKFYAKNDKERIKIAKAGHKRAHEHYNERKVAQFIEEATFGKIKSKFGWPLEEA